MSHTSRPDNTRDLPNRYLHTRHEDLVMKPVLHFRWIGALKEQLQCFCKVASRLFDGIALARNVQLRTQRDVSISFSLDDGGHVVRALHSALLVALPLAAAHAASWR